jgi:hypothetical protein
MDAHLRYLASDLLEGRAPATRGGRLAAAYVAAQFEALGLAPAGGDGSFFQPVALVGMAIQQSTFVWGTAGAAKQLRQGDDYVAWGQRPDPHTVVDGDVVFVGYGIRAAEWHWDDYKGVDLHGKILLMLVNDPGLQDSTIFRGRTLTYYGRWTYKLEEAARQGAIGAVLIHTPESATYGWPVVRGSWSVEQFQLADAAGPRLAFAAWVTRDAARSALAQSGYDLDSLTRAAARPSFTPVATRLHGAVDLSSMVRRVASENVVGMLRGADPALESQDVVGPGHCDHAGNDQTSNDGCTE